MALFVRYLEEEEEPEELLQAWSGLTDVNLQHLEGEKKQDLLKVFSHYPALFQQRPGKTTVLEHTIHLRAGQFPIRQPPYRIPEKLVGALKTEIQAMLDLEVIEPSTSEWSSPIVIVPKKDGYLRVCFDFLKLNAVSHSDAYPMPRIDELLEKVGHASFITTLDLCKGYWQVPLEEKSKAYTAFRTPMGLFQFRVMPFGLHGAPGCFQRLMDRVLQDCSDCSAAYLDDVVIFSSTWQQHLQHLQCVLGKIQEAGLTLNVQKCEWAREETRYLGYQLGKGTIRPQVDKVQAIRDSPRPTTKTQVKSFLGMIGWYR